MGPATCAGPELQPAAFGRPVVYGASGAGKSRRWGVAQEFVTAAGEGLSNGRAAGAERRAGRCARDAAVAAAVKAAMRAAKPAAVGSAGRRAVGRVGMMAGQRICDWQLGRQPRRGGRMERGGRSLPFRQRSRMCYFIWPRMTNSTRRLSARPASVSLVAIGWLSP